MRDATISFEEEVKIGARVLLEDQASILLPSYKNLHEQVKGFREQAAKDERQQEKWEGKYKRDFQSNFDNVISILGERGSGKTSVMLTFKYHHTAVFNQKDIILPLIVPDQMSGASDTLGWVLGFLHEEMSEVERLVRIKQEESNYRSHDPFCGKVSKSELEKKYKELQKAYLLRQESYASIIRKRDEGVQEQISENERIVNADQNLIDHFHEFIDLLVLSKKKVQGNTHEPLILIFFDDVDISAGNCMEILNTVRTFFSHPNIVVFVSGAYSVFVEAVTLNMLREEGVDPGSYKTDFVNQWNSTESALDRRRERSREFLKKVFPPAFRYEMKNALSDEEKAEFKYYISHSEKALTFMELLAGVKVNADGASLGSRFITNNSKHIPQAYFRIFDSNPRGLISPYYFLHLRNKKPWNGTDILQFVDIVINSNKGLTEYKSHIRDIIRIYFETDGTRLDKVRTFINYSKLFTYDIPPLKEAIYSEGYEEKLLENKIEIEISILLLADLCEKLLQLHQPDFYVADSVKIKPFTELLNQYYGANVFPMMQTMEGMLRHYDLISPIITMFERNRPLFTGEGVSHYLERQILMALSNGADVYTLLRRLYGEDQKWVSIVVQYISQIGRSNNEIMKQLIDVLKSEEQYWSEVHYHSFYNRFNNIEYGELLKLLSGYLSGNQDVDSIESINMAMIGDIISYIVTSENQGSLASEIFHKKETLRELEEEMKPLEESRWLRRQQGSSKKKSVQIIDAVIKRSDALDKELTAIRREGEVTALMREYFHQEEISINGDDVDKVFNGETITDKIKANIIEELDEDEEYFAGFNPLNILVEYLDIYSVKQLVKKEELGFVGLIYDSMDEENHLTRHQKFAVEKYFIKSREYMLLQILLPENKTKAAEHYQQLKIEHEKIKTELSKLENISESYQREKDRLLYTLALSDSKIIILLKVWENDKSSSNKNFVIRQITNEFRLIQNHKFSYYLFNLMKEYNIPNSKEDLVKVSEKILKDFWEEVAQLLQQYLLDLKNLLNASEPVADIWRTIFITLENDDSVIVMASVRHYVFIRYVLELINIREDEREQGSITYFRDLKQQLKIRAKEGYSSFDLYLKNALGVE